jgi:hypothetical protein
VHPEETEGQNRRTKESDVRGTRAATIVRCTYCGGTGTGEGLVEADLRGVRYDYCDAACAAAHQQAVELTELHCGECDEPAVGDCGFCDEHVLGVGSAAEGEAGAGSGWRMAG